MLISQYNILIYLFIGAIAGIGLYFSRRSGVLESAQSGTHRFLWFLSALSVFSASLVQFWIVLLPVVALSFSAVLIALSFTLMVVIPGLMRSDRWSIGSIEDRITMPMKRLLSAMMIVLFAVIQPFALMYVGERVAEPYLGNSYHLLMASVIGMAGLSTLIGGKRVIVISNALSGAAVIVLTGLMMAVGGSFAAPMGFLTGFFSEVSVMFRTNASLSMNWAAGFIGFSVISWFIWWMDTASFQGGSGGSRTGRSVSTLLVTGSLIITAVMFNSTGSAAEAPAASETMTFLFVLAFFSMMFSVFSHSFHAIAIFVTGYSSGRFTPGETEKHILIERLAILFSAVLIILIIPFAALLGAVTVMMYVQFLSWCSASVLGTLAVLAVRNSDAQNGAAAGIMGGMVTGIVIAVLSGLDAGVLNPVLETPYGASGLIVFGSVVSSIGGSAVSQRRIVKRSMAL
jgi:hypothetical protein